MCSISIPILPWERGVFLNTLDERCTRHVGGKGITEKVTTCEPNMVPTCFLNPFDSLKVRFEFSFKYSKHKKSDTLRVKVD